MTYDENVQSRPSFTEGQMPEQDRRAKCQCIHILGANSVNLASFHQCSTLCFSLAWCL